MAKTDRLRGALIPRDVWAFLDSNVPTLIVRLLHGYIEELEKQNTILRNSHGLLNEKIYRQDIRINELADEIERLKGNRVMSRPVNSAERSKLQKERPRYRNRHIR